MPCAPSGCCGWLTPSASSDGPGAGERGTQRTLSMTPENRRRHATSRGARIAALVSSVAGGEAAGAPTLTALFIDVLAVLR